MLLTIAFIATILLAVLKIAAIVSITWFAVFLPIVIWFGLFMTTLAIALISATIAYKKM